MNVQGLVKDGTESTSSFVDMPMRTVEPSEGALSRAKADNGLCSPSAKETAPCEATVAMPVDISRDLNMSDRRIVPPIVHKAPAVVDVSIASPTSVLERADVIVEEVAAPELSPTLEEDVVAERMPVLENKALAVAVEETAPVSNLFPSTAEPFPVDEVIEPTTFDFDKGPIQVEEETSPSTAKNDDDHDFYPASPPDSSFEENVAKDVPDRTRELLETPTSATAKHPESLTTATSSVLSESSSRTEDGLQTEKEEAGNEDWGDGVVSKLQSAEKTGRLSGCVVDKTSELPTASRSFQHSEETTEAIVQAVLASLQAVLTETDATEEEWIGEFVGQETKEGVTDYQVVDAKEATFCANEEADSPALTGTTKACDTADLAKEVEQEDVPTSEDEVYDIASADEEATTEAAVLTVEAKTTEGGPEQRVDRGTNKGDPLVESHATIQPSCDGAGLGVPAEEGSAWDSVESTETHAKLEEEDQTDGNDVPPAVATVVHSFELAAGGNKNEEEVEGTPTPQKHVVDEALEDENVEKGAVFEDKNAKTAEAINEEKEAVTKTTEGKTILPPPSRTLELKETAPTEASKTIDDMPHTRQVAPGASYIPVIKEPSHPGPVPTRDFPAIASVGGEEVVVADMPPRKRTSSRGVWFWMMASVSITSVLCGAAFWFLSDEETSPLAKKMSAMVMKYGDGMRAAVREHQIRYCAPADQGGLALAEDMADGSAMEMEAPYWAEPSLKRLTFDWFCQGRRKTTLAWQKAKVEPRAAFWKRKNSQLFNLIIKDDNGSVVLERERIASARVQDGNIMIISHEGAEEIVVAPWTA